MGERPSRLLLIEPNAERRGWLARGLGAAGFAVDARESAVEPSDPPPDCVAIALEAFGAAAVAPLRSRDPLVPVVVVTRRDARDDLPRELGAAHARDVVTVRGAADVEPLAQSLRLGVQRRASCLAPRPVAANLVGGSAAMQQVRRHVHLVATSHLSVLVRGETGTGKEVVARAIHRHGPRARKPFVSVNCAAIPEGLLESEILGHERGAFTGAASRTRGLLEQADGGTLFLDEVGEMPLEQQAKLLRVLAPAHGPASTVREFQRVGGDEPLRSDVRVIAATHRGPECLREDLWQRLAGVVVEIPPLRARPGDVADLARVFLEQACHAEGREATWFSEPALEVLSRYHWPRNVRQLQDVVRGIVVLREQSGPVVLGDLPREVFAVPAGAPPAAELPLRTLAEVEREHVERVLRACGHVQSRAAAMLGITRNRLRLLVQKLGIRMPSDTP